MLPSGRAFNYSEAIVIIDSPGARTTTIGSLIHYRSLLDTDFYKLLMPNSSGSTFAYACNFYADQSHLDGTAW